LVGWLVGWLVDRLNERMNVTCSASTVSMGLSARCETLVLPEGLYHLTKRDTDVADVLRLLTLGAYMQTLSWSLIELILCKHTMVMT